MRLLNLANNSLAGPLPASWSGMSKMMDLRMMQNKLGGPLPASWAAMHDLKTLQLQ